MVWCLEISSPKFISQEAEWDRNNKICTTFHGPHLVIYSCHLSPTFSGIHSLPRWYHFWEPVFKTWAQERHIKHIGVCQMEGICPILAKEYNLVACLNLQYSFSIPLLPTQYSWLGQYDFQLYGESSFLLTKELQKQSLPTVQRVDPWGYPLMSQPGNAASKAFLLMS